MKITEHLLPLALLLATSTTLQSCLDDNDNSRYVICPSPHPTAIVTVCPEPTGSFTMRLDDNTSLYPTNMDKSPFGEKEVRALVNFVADEQAHDKGGVVINYIDSIRTKYPVLDLGAANDLNYGNDPIEIVKDWVTVAEDGYLTLRIRTIWGPGHTPHYINLLTGINPDDPFELELRHDANGDTRGTYSDALIAFNLNELPRLSSDPVKIKLHWNSFSGMKQAVFNLTLRPHIDKGDLTDITPASQLK